MTYSHQPFAGSPLAMNKLIFILFIVLLALQYRLWLGEGGMQSVWHLEKEVTERNIGIQKLEDRNQSLQAEVIDLKRGLGALEERARSELGMISDNEVFYQIITIPADERIQKQTAESPTNQKQGETAGQQ